jgi:hypothetical protein
MPSEDKNPRNLLVNLINISFYELVMRRNSQTITATIAATTLLAFVIIAIPSPVLAANAHFIGTPTITHNTDFSLTAHFKAAGLANTVSAAFLSSSGGTANLQCQNPGGNNPPPKLVSFGPLQGRATFVQPSNGQITADPTIGPPSLPSASQICPNPSWHVVILSITYDDVVLHIVQNNQETLTFNYDTQTIPPFRTF